MVKYPPMKIAIAPLSVLTVLLTLLAGCSKKDNNDNGMRRHNLKGHILHQYTSDVKKINAATGDESAFFSYSAYSNVGWDLSRDGTLRIMAEREAGVYDRTRIMLINVADGTIIKDFDYIPPRGNNTNNMGELSFDNSLILIEPDYDNGIVILNTDGEQLHQLDAINGQALSTGDRATWLPDNSILICFDNRYILRTDPPYTSLSLVKEMNYESWGNLRVSNSGTRLSMYINNHVYTMDVDGNNLTQVTESNGEEIFGEFSPDDRHLLIGADYFHAPASRNSHWFLKAIPADGKKYNMDDGPGVIPIVPNGSSHTVRANGVTRWRPHN